MTRLQDAIQCAVFDHIRVRVSRDLVAWHTPNRARGPGGSVGCSRRTPGSHLRAGAQSARRFGDRSAAKVIADMNRAGTSTCVAEGLDEALTVLETWGLLGGATQ
jgi:hypothetical protein